MGGGMMNKLKQFCINLVSSLKANLMEHSDKVLHFAITYGIVYTLADHWTLDGAIAVGLLLGVSKEIYDKLSYGKFSLGDLLADILGIILAVLLGA